jgi:hypothetical protein
MFALTIRQPYKLFPKYPGLRPRDEVIWDDFIDKNPSAFEYVYYNVHLGEPASTDRDKLEMQQNGSYEVSQWCVDVLAYADNVPYVIEVKPDAGAGSLGQALAYREILIAEGRITPNAVSVVLTNQISPITEHAAKLLGIILLTP